MSKKQYEHFCIKMEDVFKAKVTLRDNVHITPMFQISSIQKLAGCKVALKMELMQSCRTYKYRGAYNLVANVPKGKTIVTVSDGNQAQAIALASTKLGVPNVIYLPKTASPNKIESTKNYGGNCVLVGKDFYEADEQLLEDKKQHKDWIYASPFDNEYIIAGNATIGTEIIEQLPEIDTVVVSVGGGGLIAGIAYAIKHLKPNVRVIGAQVDTNAAAYKAFKEFKGCEATGISREQRTPLADGIVVRKPGDLTFPLIQEYVDDIVLVNEDEISMAVSVLADRAKAIVEGSAASTFASVLYKKFPFREDEHVCCILSGGNIDLKMLNRCIERALFMKGERVSISIVVPYGTHYLSMLLNMIAEHHAEVVSCIASPHIDTSANREQYRVILDLPRPEIINDIEQSCIEKGWNFESHPFNLIE